MVTPSPHATYTYYLYYTSTSTYPYTRPTLTSGSSLRVVLVSGATLRAAAHAVFFSRPPTPVFSLARGSFCALPRRSHVPRAALARHVLTLAHVRGFACDAHARPRARAYYGTQNTYVLSTLSRVATHVTCAFAYVAICCAHAPAHEDCAMHTCSFRP